jgi:hypothetical protein
MNLRSSLLIFWLNCDKSSRAVVYVGVDTSQSKAATPVANSPPVSTTQVANNTCVVNNTGGQQHRWSTTPVVNNTWVNNTGGQQHQWSTTPVVNNTGGQQHLWSTTPGVNNTSGQQQRCSTKTTVTDRLNLKLLNPCIVVNWYPKIVSKQNIKINMIKRFPYSNIYAIF